uniref:Uncharacterized protein n=1 Tax=Rangifer tarandus platyrhynchus TaxID=3082113 RepID=A0ACB0E811_RANTA|nr:unnamed protein product [Rangifer tarandus platyrhynchus]
METHSLAARDPLIGPWKQPLQSIQGHRECPLFLFSSPLSLHPGALPTPDARGSSFPSSDERKGPLVVPGVLGQRPSPPVGKPCLEIARARCKAPTTGPEFQSCSVDLVLCAVVIPGLDEGLCDARLASRLPGETGGPGSR